jgi:hypothetical protein
VAQDLALTVVFDIARDTNDLARDYHHRLVYQLIRGKELVRQGFADDGDR